MHFAQVSKASTQRVTPCIKTLYPFCSQFARGKCISWGTIRAIMIDLHRVGFLGLHDVLFFYKFIRRKTNEPSV